MKDYILKHHEADIVAILKAEQVEHLPFLALRIDLTVLKKDNIILFKKVTHRIDVWKERPKWIQALNDAQDAILEMSLNKTIKAYMTKKKNFPVTFFNSPGSDNEFPSYFELYSFIQVEAIIFRSRERRKQEVKREYTCRKCKKTMMVEADRLIGFHFETPSPCPFTNGCKSVLVHENPGELRLDLTIDFQEIRIQQLSKTCSTKALIVELDEELVESCFVGDRVTICGTYETRSEKGFNDHTPVIRAISVAVHEAQQRINKDPTELLFLVKDDWENDLERLSGNELTVRDEMLSSIAPELKGLYLLKMAVALILCSGGKGSQDNNSSQFVPTSSATREISHLLMVGDPGLGKSQLLKAAAEISLNSVRAVGYGSTSAGLTASVFKEDGDWQIQAGALVKANNGVCCLDEINLLPTAHRSSIHEVMEMQKITIAKGGIRADLQAKTSILAGMNASNAVKGRRLDARNLSIEQSLLTRFDLVFELEDPHDLYFDELIADHILGMGKFGNTSHQWKIERLQMHIFVAKDIDVEISPKALEILQKYYQFCAQHPEIEVSRKSMRFWNSLERLTKSHAKLLLRSRAEIVDAVSIILLNESSWSFGYLMGSFNVMTYELPIGPTKQYIVEVLERMHLEHLLGEDEQKCPTKEAAQQSQKCNNFFNMNDIDAIFQDSDSEPEANSCTQKAVTSQKINEYSKVTQDSITSLSDDTRNSKPQTSNRSQQAYIESHRKKIRIEPDATLTANLNALNAAFLNQPTASEVPKIQSTAFEKLKKFQYQASQSAESQKSSKPSQEIVKENIPAEIKASIRSAQEEFIDNIDSFDFFGDL